MAILQAMDGKYYDVPDAEASGFEVARDKVKALLEKSGMPAPSPGGGRGGGGAPGPQQGGAPGPVVVQIFTQSPGPGGAPAPAPSGGGGQDGDVDPYWIWRNVTGYGRWWNTWGNW